MRRMSSLPGAASRMRVTGTERAPLAGTVPLASLMVPCNNARTLVALCAESRNSTPHVACIANCQPG